jgi:hypothetical protein
MTSPLANVLFFPRSNALAAAEHRSPALDERLDAFLGIFAVEHAILDLRYIVDGRPFAAFFAISSAISKARSICLPGATISWTSPIW